MDLFYSPDYTRARHAFDTTRKAGWIADSLTADPVPGVRIRPPRPADVDDLRQAHDDAYIDAVRRGTPRSLAESQGFTWDEHLWTAVTASTGGVLDAADAAIRDGVAGSLSSGLHHARRDRGAGFCTFNGLALAAERVSRRGGRALILDLDAHGGGGTWSIVGRLPGVSQVDVATNSFDSWVPSARSSRDEVRDAGAYLSVIDQRLAGAPDAELVLYNAGMDPHEHSLGGLAGIDAAELARREALVFAWARSRGVPIAFVLAGGYVSDRLAEAELVRLHRLTIAAAAASG